MVKIKICGLFREADVDFANEAGPDFVGFVFAESRRRVSPAQAAGLRSRLREGIVPVGVFVNAPPEEIAALYWDGCIGMAQLHGGEDAPYIRRLKTLSAAGGRTPVPVIKVLRMEGPAGKEWAGPAADEADYLLLDSGSGSGSPFDWTILDALKPSPRTVAFFGAPVALPSYSQHAPACRIGRLKPSLRTAADCGAPALPPIFSQHAPACLDGRPSSLLIPWFLAGGISLENIGRAVSYRPFAVDVSSGAETDGVKDRQKMIALVKQARIDGNG